MGLKALEPAQTKGAVFTAPFLFMPRRPPSDRRDSLHPG
jgi:hypothetical protein